MHKWTCIFLSKGKSFYKDNVVQYKIDDNSGRNLYNNIIVLFNSNDE